MENKPDLIQLNIHKLDMEQLAQMNENYYLCFVTNIKHTRSYCGNNEAEMYDRKVEYMHFEIRNAIDLKGDGDTKTIHVRNEIIDGKMSRFWTMKKEYLDKFEAILKSYKIPYEVLEDYNGSK